MLPPGSSRAVLAAERVRRDPRSFFTLLHSECTGWRMLSSMGNALEGSKPSAHAGDKSKFFPGSLMCMPGLK